MKEIETWGFKQDAEREKVLLRDGVAKKIDTGLDKYKRDCKERKNLGKDPAPFIDEQAWTFLMAYGYRDRPDLLFKILTGRTHPAPDACQAWLEMLPLSARKGNQEEGSEGNSNIDLIAGSIESRGNTKSGVQYRPNGPVCLVEAKWKSDIAGYTSHDPQRNQLARVIETAATLQHHTDKRIDPANRFPKDVYVTLLTPKLFKVGGPPASRFYAYKFFEYRKNPKPLVRDILDSRVDKRDDPAWVYPWDIEQRLGRVKLRWVTFEDLYASMPDKDYRKALGRFIQAQPKSSVLDLKHFPWENT